MRDDPRFHRGEAGGLEDGRIFHGRRKKPGLGSSAVDAARLEHRDERRDDGRHVPNPPNSPTNRPPGRSARRTPAATSAGRFIQCSTAFENTASNSAS
jgi:hypothetical protein